MRRRAMVLVAVLACAAVASAQELAELLAQLLRAHGAQE